MNKAWYTTHDYQKVREFFMLHLIILAIVLSDPDFVLLKNKDPELFRKFYDYYRDRLYHFFMIKTGNELESEDLVSDTFQSVLVSIKNLKNREKINSWVFQIARRRFMDHLRRKYRKGAMEVNMENEGHIADEAVIELDSDRVALFHMALDNLLPDHKQVLLWKYSENRSQKEITQLLNKNEKAVEGLLFRARKALQKEIRDLAE
jgi:RNA polymerase sigma factor (sigma-70 family)